MEVKNVLVVRFRQLGDAVLTTVICNTIRKTFPDARIDYVLNDNLAALFEGHPSIDRIITFTKEERHDTITYLKKVWRIMHETRYDVIIDKRSTFNTTPFALFSLHTSIRVALKKPYTWLLYNHRVGPVENTPMIDHILEHLKPLERICPVQYDRKMTLWVSEQEKKDFRTYLQEQGMDLNRPIALIGVTAKLENKTWPKEKMTEVLKHFIEYFPEIQLIFNYAPGKEEENARDIYQRLGAPASVFIDVQARSSRQLAAMCDAINLYFGNEGGARHIVHAMQKPSLVVCSPFANPQVWIPQDEVPAVAIRNEKATVDHVWQMLKDFTTKQIKTQL
jgi:heptosyltransferase-2